MITQDEALKKADKLFRQEKPHAVVYGYHIKRGPRSKEVHEFLDRPIICKTKEHLEMLMKNYLSKEKSKSSNITGLDVLYAPLDEKLKTKK